LVGEPLNSYVFIEKTRNLFNKKHVKFNKQFFMNKYRKQL